MGLITRGMDGDDNEYENDIGNDDDNGGDDEWR